MSRAATLPPDLPSPALRRGPPAPGLVLELFKPLTWFAPVWAFGCGLVSAGLPRTPLAVLVALAGAVLAGPLVCATSQAVNDWFDRHVDAINEPARPIPSGRIPGRWGLWLALLWTGVSLGWALLLGRFMLLAASAGLLLAWAYSAPPLRLKRNGWIGNLAVGACYEGLPWIAGAGLLDGGHVPRPVLLLAALYSLGAHGIMTLNDFKSLAGDRASGVRSLPVLLGPDRAARLACLAMLGPQLAALALLLAWHAPVHAAVLAALVAGQLALMPRLLRDPRRAAPWYNATGTSLYVLGMLCCALVLGGLA